MSKNTETGLIKYIHYSYPLNFEDLLYFISLFFTVQLSACGDLSLPTYTRSVTLNNLDAAGSIFRLETKCNASSVLPTFQVMVMFS